MSHCGCSAQAGGRLEFTAATEAGDQADLLQVEKKKYLALKEIMMQPDYHKARAESVFSSTAGHCHCQNLWDFCRDTKGCPAVR